MQGVKLLGSFRGHVNTYICQLNVRSSYPIITRMCHLKVSQLLGEDIKMHTYVVSICHLNVLLKLFNYLIKKTLQGA